jgi:diaminopimelate epimerase
MTLAFTKMNGAGNDFIALDNREGGIRLAPGQIARLCHRQRGIGADGLFLVAPCASGRAEWAWDFYNSDGSTAEMCGNGARCFARFVQRLTGVAERLAFETAAGVIGAEFEGERVTVTLTRPKDLRLRQALVVDEQTLEVHSLDTGVPHAVLCVADADQAMVQPLGARIRHHPHFSPRGTNVDFVQLLGPGSIRVRTYERGVEGETLACGTGVTASALVMARLHGFPSPIRVQVQSGDTLEVRFEQTGRDFDRVRLHGPAEFVFEGRIEVP